MTWVKSLLGVTPARSKNQNAPGRLRLYAGGKRATDWLTSDLIRLRGSLRATKCPGASLYSRGKRATTHFPLGRPTVCARSSKAEKSPRWLNHNRLIRSQALYPLSYGGLYKAAWSVTLTVKLQYFIINFSIRSAHSSSHLCLFSRPGTTHHNYHNMEGFYSVEQTISN